MTTFSAITVEQLSKYYGQTLGIRDLSFAVNRGEIFGFLGPNGAGKTTTIRLLLDLLRPTSGEIKLFEKPLFQHTVEIRQNCGYLPGNFSAYADMTGEEYLRFVAHLRSLPFTRPTTLLNKFELSHAILLQKIKYLSHGTRQKLGIVQAFFHQPELLILDEPTIGLDPLMQEVFYDLLRESRNAGRTIFFSSHNLPEVEKVCDRVAIIRKGELVALETLENLKKKRFRRLKLILSEPVDQLHLSGTELLGNKGLEYDFLVKSDILALLKQLIDLPIADFVFPEPDLEEVFMTYYRSEESE